MNPVVIIPARGGSKGVPGKNIKLLGEKPLIQYTIDAARTLFEDDKILVSTDDVNIKKCVEDLGLNIPFLRPASLATDNAGMYDVLLQGIKFLESNNMDPDVLILLQPTSPFRSSRHIREAFEIYNSQKDIDMVVSVVETKANPYYVLFEENEEGFLKHSKDGNFNSRQDCPKVWQYNGAIYIINIDSLKKTSISRFDKVIKYVMDEESSHDIDTKMDWLLAERILDKNFHNKD